MSSSPIRSGHPRQGLRTAGAGDAAPAALIGHTALLSGTATRGAQIETFMAVLDVAAGTQMVGGPFDLAVDERTDAILHLTLFTLDPAEGDTLFDGLDFALLDGDTDGQVDILPGSEAHNILMKTLIRHDHWGVITD
jgi:hypothetical protein